MNAAELLGGMALAATAACCYDGAIALQAVEARSVPDASGGAGLLRSLVGRPRWLAATGLAALGWPLQIAALALAPLTVVQPTMAVGLVLLLFLGVRLLNEPARPRDLVAAAAVGAGVGILAWAAPEPDHIPHVGAGFAVVVGGLAALTATPWVARGRVRAGWLLVVAAGSGNAGAALTSKLLADELSAGTALAVLGWAAASAGLAAVALSDEMAALQRVGAARVAAGAFAIQVAVPVACAPLLTGEHWADTPLGGGALVAGLALVLGGAVRLGSARAVSRLVAGAHR